MAPLILSFIKSSNSYITVKNLISVLSLLAKSLAKVFGLTLKPTVITELSEATASTTSD